jgi:hypothetical protein
MRRLACVLTLLVGACRPPESERTRGGGPGADPGNRVDDLVIHERRSPDSVTPLLRDESSAAGGVEGGSK